MEKLYSNFLMQTKKEKENIKEQQSKAAPAVVYNPIYLQKNFRLGKYFSD